MITKASWYGKKFQHKKTANGERYDMYKYTAAHRSLPIGCYARVTNLRNNKSVIVRINDRPSRHNKRLDLSYAAAKAIGISGVDQVKIEY